MTFIIAIFSEKAEKKRLVVNLLKKGQKEVGATHSRT